MTSKKTKKETYHYSKRIGKTPADCLIPHFEERVMILNDWEKETHYILDFSHVSIPRLAEEAMVAIQRMYDEEEYEPAELAGMVHVVELFSQFAEEWNGLTLAQRKNRYLDWSDLQLWNINERLQIGIKIKSFCDGSNPEEDEDSVVTFAFGTWCEMRERENENLLDFADPWITESHKRNIHFGRMLYCRDKQGSIIYYLEDIKKWWDEFEGFVVTQIGDGDEGGQIVRCLNPEWAERGEKSRGR